MTAKKTVAARSGTPGKTPKTMPPNERKTAKDHERLREANEELKNEIRVLKESRGAQSPGGKGGTIPVPDDEKKTALPPEADRGREDAERREHDTLGEPPGRPVNIVADAIISLDPAGKIIFWNEAARKLYGSPPDGVLGRDLRSVIAPEPVAGDELAGKNRELDELREELHATGEQVRKNLDALQGREEELVLAYESLDAASDNVSALQAELSRGTGELRKRGDELKDALAEKDLLREEIRHRESELKDALAGTESLQSEIRQRGGELNVARAGKEEIQSEIRHREDELKDSRAEKEVLQSTIRKREDELNEALAGKEHLHTEIQQRESDLKDALSEKEHFQSEIQNRENALKNSLAEKEVLQREIQQRGGELKDAVSEKTVLQDGIRHREDELKDAVCAKELLQAEILQCESDLNNALAEKEALLTAVSERTGELKDALSEKAALLNDIHTQMGGMKDAFAGTEALRTEIRKRDGELAESLTANERLRAELRRREEELRGALSEKAALKNEIDSRAGSTAATAIPAFHFEGLYDDSPAGLAIKKDLKNRARSLSLNHETLLPAGNAPVEMEAYLTALAGKIAGASLSPRPVMTVVDAKGIALDPPRAATAGLIVNELLTNSLTHGFPRSFDCEKHRGGRCTVRVTLEREDGDYILTVRDNGTGLPKDLDIHTTKTLGLRIVNFLARRRLRAKVEILLKNGAGFRFRFRDKPEHRG